MRAWAAQTVKRFRRHDTNVPTAVTVAVVGGLTVPGALCEIEEQVAVPSAQSTDLLGSEPENESARVLVSHHDHQGGRHS